MDMNTLIAQAQAAADKLEDQTEVQEGGFSYEVPPAGPTPARFVGYVECGVRKQKPYQGKDKPDAEEVRLYFELNGKKHQREVEVEGVKKTFTNTISIKVAKKLNDKAGFTKLMRKMAYGRDEIKHMAQMLGEGFIITIVHNEVERDNKKVTYANMKDSDGTWLIGAPQVADPMTGDTTQVPVPAMTQTPKVLLWNAPTQEQWDSIFIDGTRTVKNEKGEEVEVSKNWLQEDIVQNAVNFEGSPLQALIGGIGDLDLEPETAPEADPVTGAEDEKKSPDNSDDLMASLGL